MAAFADAGVIAAREPQYHLMHAGSVCRANDVPGRRVRSESADVLCNGAVEELHFLRQVADTGAERLGLPKLERGAVETNLPAGHGPYTHQSTRQRRLA